MISRKAMQLRQPKELKDWIQVEAIRNGSAQNTEVVRTIKDPCASNELEKGEEQ